MATATPSKQQIGQRSATPGKTAAPGQPISLATVAGRFRSTVKWTRDDWEKPIAGVWDRLSEEWRKIMAGLAPAQATTAASANVRSGEGAGRGEAVPATIPGTTGINLHLEFTPDQLADLYRRENELRGLRKIGGMVAWRDKLVEWERVAVGYLRENGERMRKAVVASMAKASETQAKAKACEQVKAATTTDDEEWDI